MNYFDFYELPFSFEVDKQTLKKAYYAKSRALHPDFHATQNAQQQQQALELSTFNNKAFQTLSDDHARLAYILQLLGAMPAEGAAQLPPDFLAEMMDINEAIMELEFDFDENIYIKIKNDIENIEKQIFIEVKDVFQHCTPNTATETQLAVVKNYFFKHKYILRIKENFSKFAPPC